jgi:hypothetical protein
MKRTRIRSLEKRLPTNRENVIVFQNDDGTVRTVFGNEHFFDDRADFEIWVAEQKTKKLKVIWLVKGSEYEQNES